MAVSSEKQSINIQALNLDKMINDLIDIFASLDGRVKKLELKLCIKKRPSYLKVVDQASPSLEEELRLAQSKNSLELLSKAANSLVERLEKLESTI